MKYIGMTVNERLYMSGYIDAYDKAVKEKDINKIRKILQEVEIDEESIKIILQYLDLNSTNVK